MVVSVWWCLWQHKDMLNWTRSWLYSQRQPLVNRECWLQLILPGTLLLGSTFLRLAVSRSVSNVTEHQWVPGHPTLTPAFLSSLPCFISVSWDHIYCLWPLLPFLHVYFLGGITKIRSMPMHPSVLEQSQRTKLGCEFLGNLSRPLSWRLDNWRVNFHDYRTYLVICHTGLIWPYATQSNLSL